MKKRDKVVCTELNKSAIEILLPLGVILVFIILTFVGIINALGSKGEARIYTEDEIWSESYKKYDGINAAIFDEMNTTKEIYLKLKIASSDYIEKNNVKIDSTKTNTKILLDDTLYADKSITNTRGINITNNSEKTETGPIYAENMLLSRYIDNNGNLIVLISNINSKTDIKTLESKNVVKELGLFSLNVESKESEYLKNVSNSLIKMITVKSSVELENMESDIYTYFNTYGKSTVLDGRDTIKFNSNSTIELAYAVAGKSSLDLVDKDRIYMKLLIKSKDSSNYCDIILKLNDNGKIFDIDII